MQRGDALFVAKYNETPHSGAVVAVGGAGARDPVKRSSTKSPMSSVPTSAPTWLRIEAYQGTWAEGSMSRYFTGAARWSLSADVRTCLNMGAAVRVIGAGLRAPRVR
jgi:hypothetical protein